MSNIISYVPSFVVRGINPENVLKKYLQKDYSQIRYTFKENRTVAGGAPINVVAVHNSTVNDGIYIYRDRGDSNRIIAFTNQKEYETFLKTNSFSKDRICEHCGEKVGDEGMGIPTERKLAEFDGGNIYLLYSTGNYCDFMCMYTAFNQKHSLPYQMRDYSLNESYRLIKWYHNTYLPDKPFQQTNDVRLLKRYGGPLEYTEWKKNIYHKMGNVTVSPPLQLPSKGVYIKST